MLLTLSSWVYFLVAGLGGLADNEVVGQAPPPRTMTISAIFDEGGEVIHELAFQHAVQVVNRNR